MCVHILYKSQNEPKMIEINQEKGPSEIKL